MRRKCSRGCDWCLMSRTLYVAPTEEGYEALYLKYQPRSAQSRFIKHSWKKTKVRRQWMRHFNKHQDLAVEGSIE